MWRTIIVLLVLENLAINGLAQEWTRFRGPNGTGISDAKSILVTWTEKDINWKVSLPGAGHSSPVLWGEQIFLTSADADTSEFFVLCINAANGAILWRKAFPLTKFHKHDYNSFASGSPAADAKRVYACWSSPARYSLVALSHDGKQIWEKDLGPFASQHGSGTSPIVYQDKVVLANEQDGESFLIAVDAATGEVRWKTPRKTTQAAYSTPCLYQAKERKPELIFNSQSHGISAIDPENGNVLWEFEKAFDKRSVSSPVVAGDLIIGSCGSGGGGNFLVAIRPGDITKSKPPELAYTIKRAAPYVPTSISFGDLLFLWGDGGIVSCVQASSGEIKWQERVGGDYFGSPVCVDGKLYCVSSRGEVVVVEASEHFKLLARNSLGEQTHSTPAVAGGRMYIHTIRHLVSVGGREGVGALN